MCALFVQNGLSVSTHFLSRTNGLVSPYLLYCSSRSVGIDNLPDCEDQQSLQ